MIPLKVFICAFLCGFIIVSCQQKESKKAMQNSQECVDHIFKKDDSLGTVRNHASEEISLSETIKRYTAALNHLDFSNCPDEFSAAFNEHIVSWNQMEDVTDKYPDLRGEMHDLFDIIDKSRDSIEFRSHLKAIWDTWEPIEKARNTK